MPHQAFEKVDQQRSRLALLGGIVMAAMCGALILVSWGGEGASLDLGRRWPTLVGLAGLVLLFVLYNHHRYRQLAILEQRLRDLAVREASLQARFGELSFLFDTSTQLQLRLDLQSMLDMAVQRLIPCLDAHQASIMLFDDTSGTLEVKAAAGVDAQLVIGGRVKPGEGIAGHAFSTGEALNLTPESMANRFSEHRKQGRKIAGGLCVPMRFRGTPIGVVSVSRSTGEAFSDLHLKMLASFAEHCAASVLKTHHHHEMLKQVRRVA